MEVKTTRVSLTKTNTSAQAKVTIPLAWAKELGITEDDRKVVMTFDNGIITIKKAE